MFSFYIRRSNSIKKKHKINQVINGGGKNYGKKRKHR
jgi:hypothetical protein